MRASSLVFVPSELGSDIALGAALPPDDPHRRAFAHALLVLRARPASSRRTRVRFDASSPSPPLRFSARSRRDAVVVVVPTRALVRASRPDAAPARAARRAAAGARARIPLAHRPVPERPALTRVRGFRRPRVLGPRAPARARRAVAPASSSPAARRVRGGGTLPRAPPRRRGFVGADRPAPAPPRAAEAAPARRRGRLAPRGTAARVGGVGSPRTTKNRRRDGV